MTVSTHADLSGYEIGENFVVRELAGRDRNGPRWDVWCRRCRSYQIVPHARLAAIVASQSPENLRCANEGCPMSRHAQHSETLTEYRRRERREAEQRAREAAEAQAKAEREAVKEQAKRDHIERLRLEYIRFWNHQIKTDAPEKEICTFARWCELYPETKRMVFEKIAENPKVWFQNL